MNNIIFHQISYDVLDMSNFTVQELYGNLLTVNEK